MYTFEKVSPELAETLQKLARESKRHWGYSDEYMGKWNHHKTITSEFILGNPIFCAKKGNNIAGFYAFDINEAPVNLSHFWVAPPFIGYGVGKALFKNAMDYLSSRGVTEFQVTVEPNAEGFYVKMGGKKVDEKHRPELNQTYPVMYVKVPQEKPDKANAADS